MSRIAQVVATLSVLVGLVFGLVAPTVYYDMKAPTSKAVYYDMHKDPGSTVYYDMK